MPNLILTVPLDENECIASPLDFRAALVGAAHVDWSEADVEDTWNAAFASTAYEPAQPRAGAPPSALPALLTYKDGKPTDLATAANDALAWLQWLADAFRYDKVKVDDRYHREDLQRRLALAIEALDGFLPNKDCQFL